MRTTYIVAGYRSAVGKSGKGAFKFTRPDDLAADVIKYLVTAALVRFSMFGLVMVIFNLYLLRLNYDTRFI